MGKCREKIAIVGAGASGLMLGMLLSQSSENQVFIFEKNSKVGQKLRASGGGKANVLNHNLSPNAYNNSTFVQSLFQEFPIEHLKSLFENQGMLLRIDEEERIYPATMSAQSVVDWLLHNLGENVQLLCETEVRRIQQKDKRWKLLFDTKIQNLSTECLFDYVVLATGSAAGISPKNASNYNSYLSSFNLKHTPLLPSLVGFKIKNYPKSLFGCRSRAKVSLYQENRIIYSEVGEVMFKEDGVSGIVVLNISSVYNRLKNKANCTLQLDLLCDYPELDEKRYWKQFGTFCGVLPPKLNALYEKKPFSLRKFCLEIDALYGMEFAQVCHGGVSVEELNAHWELKKFPGIYMMGELLDIDGACGGFNLAFAFASACKVAKELIHGN